MKITIKKSTLYYGVLLFMADHCLWLVNANIQNRANELCWIMILVPLVLDIFKTKSNINQLVDKNKYYYGKEVLFTVVMCIYSTLQACLLHGQTILQGAAPQRFMVIGFFLYFVLLSYINRSTYGLENIKKIFTLLGYFELLLYISQYFMVNTIRFLQIGYSERLGEIRMSFGAIAVPYIIFNSIDSLFQKRGNTIVNFFLAAAGLFYTIEISKTRIALVAYMVAILAGYFVWKSASIRKLVFLGLIIAAVIGFTQTSLFSFLIEGLNGVDLSSQTRILGRAYYLSKIKEHILLGCGYLNVNNVASVAYSGMNSIETGNIYWVDLGVYGMTFFFGFIGLVWFILLYGKMTWQSYAIAKKGNTTFWMYCIYMIVLSPNGTGFVWYISSTICFVVWMCFIEAEYKQKLVIPTHLQEKMM